jgi:hypothetical protein
LLLLYRQQHSILLLLLLLLLKYKIAADASRCVMMMMMMMIVGCVEVSLETPSCLVLPCVIKLAAWRGVYVILGGDAAAVLHFHFLHQLIADLQTSTTTKTHQKRCWFSFIVLLSRLSVARPYDKLSTTSRIAL